VKNFAPLSNLPYKASKHLTNLSNLLVFFQASILPIIG
jgi:hypothetical protein